MNAVTEIARQILALRGKTTQACSTAELISAYDRAERITESMLRLAQRINKRLEREAA